MTYILGKSTVDDFDTWKSSFADNDSFRSEHGQRGYQVFQSVDDPNDVTVLFEWDDEDDPEAFFRSDEMRERMADAGLNGQPELSTLVEQMSTIRPSP